MKIGILAPGMRGDVEPHLALARELQARGHQVTLGSHGIYGQVCHELKIPFRALDRTDVQEIARSLMHASPKPSRSRSLSLLWRTLRTRPTWGDFRDLDAAVEICRESDLVICGPGPVPHVCEKYTRPCVLTRLTPYEINRAFPLPNLPLALHLLHLPAWVNQLTHWLFYQHLHRRMRDWLRAWRTQALGLLPVSGRLSPFELACPTLLACSPRLLPCEVRLRANCHFTGFWHLNRGRAWVAPTELAQFLALGKPPVYLGFGSLAGVTSEFWNTVVLPAVRTLGLRAVIGQGWMQGSAPESTPDLLVVGDTPFDWLFSRMAACVHHAGAGTLAEAARTGVVSVVIPFSGEQSFWAVRAFRAGAATRPVHFTELTPQLLAERLKSATEDGPLRASAQALGALLQREAGTRRAAEIIEHQKL